MKKTTLYFALLLSISLITFSHAQNITEVGRLYATLEIGQYIVIDTEGPIKVFQDESASDPFHTFKGCIETQVESNFDAALRGSAQATSAAQGDWSVSIDPEILPQGTNAVTICIMGLNVQTQNLQSAQSDVPVAEIVIEVMPIQ